MVAGPLAGRSSVDAPSGSGIWESDCIFRTSVEPRERPFPERDTGQLPVGSGCLWGDGMAVAAGGPVFGRVADGTTSPADFLLPGRYYVGARSAYGVSCRRPFAGGSQVARIVGRDTSELSAQEVRTAALETLAENLSDGVVAPLFWYLLLGVPGMLAYKMVNTLDSMIGYRNERYRRFGCFAARLDDVANFIPARLTAFLMVVVSGRLSLLGFVARYGSQHASPNSGYPESALAGILNCRFGGPHNYFGEEVWKPYIGDNERPLTTEDMHTAIRINRRAEGLMILLVLASFCIQLLLQ